MKKQLNTSSVANELAGGSAFFPNYKKNDSPAPLLNKEDVTSPPVTEALPAIDPNTLREEPKQAIPERSNARTPVRPNAKRIITRNSFEIYEDQMDSLRKLAYLEKMEGKIGSMSAMVREAIDTYLKRKPTEK